MPKRYRRHSRPGSCIRRYSHSNPLRAHPGRSARDTLGCKIEQEPPTANARRQPVACKFFDIQISWVGFPNATSSRLAPERFTCSATTASKSRRSSRRERRRRRCLLPGGTRCACRSRRDAGFAAEQENLEGPARRIEIGRNKVGAVEIVRERPTIEESAREGDPDAVIENQEPAEFFPCGAVGTCSVKCVGIGEADADRNPRRGTADRACRSLPPVASRWISTPRILRIECPLTRS